MQPASHSSWVHDSGFVFTGGAFRDFEKGAFAPFFTISFLGGLAVALPAAFYTTILGFLAAYCWRRTTRVEVGWVGEMSGGALGGRDRRLEGELKEPWKGEIKEAAGGMWQEKIFYLCE
jgi:hypothetical protein